ncbi:MAG: hypothetical protein FJY56_03145 [Betaproteobacteria bacterium]|nr:hypothetical protein [Betaproteobacteria bacterium]
MRRFFRWWLILAISAFSVAPLASAADFTFAAFGDTPYTEDEEPLFVDMIGEMNREKLAFAIHVGDFKRGSSPCSDAVFEQRAEWFALFHHALIYTLGDNEWSDCRRLRAGRHDPLERLQKLRSLFFADAYSLGQNKITLTRQSGGYPENARWVHQGVVFATLNVPGGNNNLHMPKEFAARGKALDAWIRETFAYAQTHHHRAVVLVMQANPFVSSIGTRNGYAELLAAMTRASLDFAGEVLLIHGDTHRYRFDQPLVEPQSRRRVGNFTRLDVFGYPFMNWVRVRVSQRDGRIVFSAAPGFRPN